MQGSGEECSGLRGSLGPTGAGAGNTEVAKVRGKLGGVRRRLEAQKNEHEHIRALDAEDFYSQGAGSLEGWDLT